ncbi:MAG: hypothetical protein FWC45_08965, partial [Treponema sp.]|nr:hypothetical protein [Treponema sp.]
MPDVINKVISFISGDGEGGSDKDILLKQLARDISQNKYAKFYRVKQKEADPSLGQYFYSLYKAVYPLQLFLKDPAKEAKIRHITLEAFLDKQVLDLIKQLSREGIAERKKNASADLTKQLENDLAALAKGFDSPKVAAADKCYNLIASMRQFVFFNFCSLLNKFDPEMREGDFLSQPKFASVEGEILMPDIAAFLAILPPFEPGDNWKTVFEIVKYCNGGADVISPVQWNSLLIGLKDVKQSRIFDLIGRLTTGNPIWEVKPVVPHETLSGSWLEEKNREIREVITGIAGNQRNAQIKALEKAIFGATETVRLHFFTAEKGKVMSDKGLDSYTYAPALNYLYSFIEDYLSKEIQELCDILLVRGQWTNNFASRQMSDGYHDVIEIAEEINALDDSLDEEGSNGPRLRGALLRVDRDKTQTR